MFQPHGFGPLSKMGEQLADSFAEGHGAEDRLYLPDPVYQGGTAERTRGSDWLAAAVNERDKHADHLPQRAAICDALVTEAQARRPHPDHGSARRHADRFRPGTRRADEQSELIAIRGVDAA